MCIQLQYSFEQVQTSEMHVSMVMPLQAAKKEYARYQQHAAVKDVSTTVGIYCTLSRGAGRCSTFPVSLYEGDKALKV